MRYHTPLEKMSLIGQRPEHGQITPPGSLLIDPGRPQNSEHYIRTAHRGPRQMPPLATKLTDPRGLAVLREWIRQMQPAR